MSDNSPSKNPLQESKKESSLSYENGPNEKAKSSFPDDMLARWRAFEMKNEFGFVKKEKEIFQGLIQNQGPDVFEYCGRVVSFLEEHGTGKADNSKVHCPMIYIEKHWADNLRRYQDWKQSEEKQKEREDRAKQAALKKEEKEKNEAKLLEESNALKASLLAKLGNTLGAVALDAFAEEAVTEAKLPHLTNAWTRSKWNSISVQNHVVNYFLEVQSGQRRSQIYSEYQERTA